MKMLIKKNDIVKVISGDDKGKEGRVIETQAKKARVLVEGVNIHKRHMRKSPANPDGGIMEREFPIAYSNVMSIPAILFTLSTSISGKIICSLIPIVTLDLSILP